jgi:hypothetical protein
MTDTLNSSSDLRSSAVTGGHDPYQPQMRDHNPCRVAQIAAVCAVIILLIVLFLLLFWMWNEMEEGDPGLVYVEMPAIVVTATLIAPTSTLSAEPTLPDTATLPPVVATDTATVSNTAEVSVWLLRSRCRPPPLWLHSLRRRCCPSRWRPAWPMPRSGSLGIPCLLPAPPGCRESPTSHHRYRRLRPPNRRSSGPPRLRCRIGRPPGWSLCDRDGYRGAIAAPAAPLVAPGVLCS